MGWRREGRRGRMEKLKWKSKPWPLFLSSCDPQFFVHSRVAEYVCAYGAMCVFVCCYAGRFYLLHGACVHLLLCGWHPYMKVMFECMAQRRKIQQLTHELRNVKERLANRIEAGLSLWALPGRIFGIPVKLSEYCCPDRAWMNGHASGIGVIPQFPKYLKRSKICLI